MKYIAYGSNMSREQMAFCCPGARLVGTGYIEKAQLEFYLHATVEPTRRKADRVPVAVWEISERDEQSLDHYEGFPNYYIKQERLVRMNDCSRIKGIVYLMNIIRTQPPTMGYYEGIRSAYEELGLSSEIETVLEPAAIRALQRSRARR